MNCSDKEYRIDFCGDEEFYTNVKPSYKAGEEVTVYFSLLAMDTEFYFKIDGKEIHPDYKVPKGFEIKFTMPEHDVRIECIQKNTLFNI